MKQYIFDTISDSLTAHRERHVANVRVMLANPLAIHDHTDFIEAIIKELGHIAECTDKLEALQLVRSRDFTFP